MYSKLYNETWKYGKVKILKAALSGTEDEICLMMATFQLYFLQNATTKTKKVTSWASKTRKFWIITAASCPYHIGKHLFLNCAKRNLHYSRLQQASIKYTTTYLSNPFSNYTT